MSVSARRLYGAHGLILSDRRSRTGLGEQDYIRAERRGELVRVRRGAYCEASHWNALGSRERHILRMRAVDAAAAMRPVFRSYSAGAVWGMPILGEWSSDVHVCCEPSAGGRSSPGVRRHPLAPTEVVEREGLLVTGLASTVLDVALATDFAPAVATLDWALWRKNDFRITADSVRAELEGRARKYTGNLTPGEIVWREKKREDRLRRQCSGVIRIIWSEARNPRLLDRQLREFGLTPA